MNKSQILITGGAGYIGSHAVHHFIAKGIKPADIIVLDNLIYGHCEYLPSGVNLVKGDLSDAAMLEKVFEDNCIKTVIHYAAFAYVGESMTEPGKYFINNIGGGLNLLEAMRKHDCRQIIFSSTCATYGLPEKMPITEQTPQQPINPYGESKLMFEKILEWYGSIHQIKSIRLRYFNACGAGYGIGENHQPETHLIPLAISAAIDQKKTIDIFGIDYDTRDGTCERDYIHVVDLAESHFQAMNYLSQMREMSEYLNLGTGQSVSVQEIIDLVEDVAGRKLQVRKLARRAGDPPVLVSDPAKAEKILKWRAERDIRQSISDAWEWHCGVSDKLKNN